MLFSFLHFVEEIHINFTIIKYVIEKSCFIKTLNKSSLFLKQYTYLHVFYSIAYGTVASQMVPWTLEDS